MAMSEPEYFLRCQGKLTGPFTLKHLRTLRQRGHVGRFHEVSEDRQSWAPIASLLQSNEPEQVRSEAPSGVDGLWFFADGRGQSQGPVPFQTLLSLAQTGRLHGSTLCVRQGTNSWL